MKHKIIVMLSIAASFVMSCNPNKCDEDSSQVKEYKLSDDMKFKINEGDTLIYKSEASKYDTMVVVSKVDAVSGASDCIGGVRSKVKTELQTMRIIRLNPPNREDSIIDFEAKYPVSFLYLWHRHTAYKSPNLQIRDSTFTKMYYISDDDVELWANLKYGLVAFRSDTSDLYVIHEIK